MSIYYNILKVYKKPWCAIFKPHLYIIGSGRPPVVFHLEEFDPKIFIHETPNIILDMSQYIGIELMLDAIKC